MNDRRTVGELLSLPFVWWIPSHQRPYYGLASPIRLFWKMVEKQTVARLAGEDPSQYYLGVVIVDDKTDPNATDEIGHYDLIDGQQRLATIQIALLALIQVAGKHGYGDAIKEKLEKYVLSNRVEKKPRLFLTDFDNKQFQSILFDTYDIDFDAPKISQESINKSKIVENFDFFKKAFHHLINNEDAEHEKEKIIEAMISTLTGGFELGLTKIHEYSYRGRNFSSEELRLAAPDIQREVMEEWFRENFENPAEQTPYAEGKYWFVSGGPYEPQDELQIEFDDIVEEDVISPLTEELWNECSDWAPTSSGNFCIQEFDDYPYENFEKSIGNVKFLLSAFDENHNVRGLFYSLLYVNVISAIEVYLSDTFHQKIEEDANLFRRFVETTPEFKKEKVTVSNVYETMDKINRRVNRHLKGIIWHRLVIVGNMYKDTLGISFPQNKGIFRAIEIRHKIVHKNSPPYEISFEKVEELIREVERFVSGIEEGLATSGK